MQSTVQNVNKKIYREYNRLYHARWQKKNRDKMNKYQRDRRK